jgi:hypothetical protein
VKQQILSGKADWRQHPIPSRFQQFVACPFPDRCYAVNRMG